MQGYEDAAHKLKEPTIVMSGQERLNLKPASSGRVSGWTGAEFGVVGHQKIHHYSNQLGF